MWSCPICTLQNPSRKRRCGACGERRPVDCTASVEEKEQEKCVGSCVVEPNSEQQIETSESRTANTHNKRSSVKGWLQTKKRQRHVRETNTVNISNISDPEDYDYDFNPPLVALLDDRHVSVRLKSNGELLNGFVATLEPCNADENELRENNQVQLESFHSDSDLLRLTEPCGVNIVRGCSAVGDSSSESSLKPQVESLSEVATTNFTTSLNITTVATCLGKSDTTDLEQRLSQGHGNMDEIQSMKRRRVDPVATLDTAPVTEARHLRTPAQLHQPQESAPAASTAATKSVGEDGMETETTYHQPETTQFRPFEPNENVPAAASIDDYVGRQPCLAFLGASTTAKTLPGTATPVANCKDNGNKYGEKYSADEMPCSANLLAIADDDKQQDRSQRSNDVGHTCDPSSQPVLDSQQQSDSQILSSTETSMGKPSKIPADNGGLGTMGSNFSHATFHVAQNFEHCVTKEDLTHPDFAAGERKRRDCRDGRPKDQTDGLSDRIFDKSFATSFFYTQATQSQESQTELPNASERPALRVLNGPPDKLVSTTTAKNYSCEYTFQHQVDDTGPADDVDNSHNLLTDSATAEYNCHNMGVDDEERHYCHGTTASASAHTTSSAKVSLTTVDRHRVKEHRPPATALSALKASSFLRGDLVDPAEHSKCKIAEAGESPSSANNLLRRRETSYVSSHSKLSTTFRTAGLGSAVTVSEEAVAKGKKFLEESQAPTETLATTVGAVFHSAGLGQQIAVTSTNWLKAKSLFTNIEWNGNKINVESKDSEKSRHTLASDHVSPHDIAGLSQGCAASSNGLHRASSLQTGNRLSERENLIEKIDDPPVSQPTLAAFRTVGVGQILTVSSNSLDRARSLLARPKPERDPVILGNAEKCRIESGEYDLSASKKVLGKESHSEVPVSSLSKVADFVRCERESKQFLGNRPSTAFQTAGLGAAISISDASLAKANTVLRGQCSHEHITATTDTDLLGRTAPNRSAVTPRFVMHQNSAGFSASKLAETETVAIQKSQLFHRYETPLVPSASSTKVGPLAFRTAGRGNEVVASASSLARAEGLLHDEGDASSRGSTACHTTTSADSASSTQMILRRNGSPLVHGGHSASLQLLTDKKNISKGENLRGGCETDISHQSFSPAPVIFRTAGLGHNISVSYSELFEAEKLLNSLGPDRPPSTSAVTEFHAPAAAFKSLEDRYKNLVSVPPLGRVQSNANEENLYFSDFLSLSFQTGLGNKILVPASGIAEAEKLLNYGSDKGNLQAVLIRNDEENEWDEQAQMVGTIVAANSSHSPAFISGFQTAGLKKEMLISDASVENAQKVLQDPPSCAVVDDPFHTVEASMKNVCRVLENSPCDAPDTVSFRTAGAGIAVSISNANLQQGRHFFLNSVDEKPTSELPQYDLADIRSKEGYQPLLSFGGTVSSSVDGTATGGPPFQMAQCATDCEDGTAFCQENLQVSFGLKASVSVHSDSLSAACVCEDTVVSSACDDGMSGCSKTPALAKLLRPAAGNPYITPGFSINHSQNDSSVGDRMSRLTGTPNDILLHGSLEGTTTPSCVDQHLNPREKSTDEDSYTSAGKPHLPPDEAFRDCLTLSDYEQCLINGVSPVTIDINSVNASSVLFDPKSLLPAGFDADDSIRSTMKQQYIGFTDDLRMALMRLGCDGSVINDKWILNHSRWIIWKYASIERTYAPTMGGKWLTYDRVVCALLHRYQKEIKGGARPAVRRILNRDAAPNRMIILCIARIKRENAKSVLDQGNRKENIIVELTDGWYALPAMLDNALSEFVDKGRIRTGTKLLVSNATLVGFEEGVDPLDDSFDSFKPGASPMLHVFANSTRLASYKAKLGFVRPTAHLAAQQGLLLLRKVSDIIEGGGRIPLIYLQVVERHPIMFLERVPEGGKGRVFTEKEENRRIEDEEKRRQRLIDRVYDEVSAECLKEVDDDAPPIWGQMMNVGSSAEFFESLDAESRSLIENWNLKRSALLRDKMEQEIHTKLEELDFISEPSTPFVRVLVRSQTAGHGPSSEEAMLTIWNPSDEQFDLLRTGNVLSFQNLDCKDSRFDSMVQLTGNNSTPISVRAQISKHLASRTFTSMFRLQLTTKRSRTNGTQDVSTPPISVMGFLFASKAQIDSDIPTWTVCVVDESFIRLHVQLRSTETSELESVLASFRSQSNDTGVTDFRVVAFHDLELQPLDSSDESNSIVALYTARSSFDPDPSCGRAERLRRWAQSNSGHKRLRKQAHFINLGVQDKFYPRRLDALEAIGFITGFLVLPGKPQVMLQVDCGGPIQMWKLPLATMTKFAATCVELDHAVALKSDEEATMKKLTTIGGVFRARQSPLRFSLKRTRQAAKFDSCFEIVNIANLDTKALSALYLAFLDS